MSSHFRNALKIIFAYTACIVSRWKFGVKVTLRWWPFVDYTTTAFLTLFWRTTVTVCRGVPCNGQTIFEYLLIRVTSGASSDSSSEIIIIRFHTFLCGGIQKIEDLHLKQKRKWIAEQFLWTHLCSLPELLASFCLTSWSTAMRRRYLFQRSIKSVVTWLYILVKDRWTPPLSPK